MYDVCDVGPGRNNGDLEVTHACNVRTVEKEEDENTARKG